MKIRDILDSNPSWISGEASVADAVQFMREHNCAFLPILENSKPIGVVTDRDIALAVGDAELELAATNIKLVMSPELHSITMEASLEEAAQHMTENHVRRLVVLDLEGFAGVISIVDLIGKVSQEAVNATLNSLLLQNHPRPHYIDPTQPVPGQFLG